MKTVKMTFDEYDKLEEICQNIDTKSGSWFPSVDEIDYYLEKFPAKNIVSFFLWILNTYTGEETPDFLKSKKHINEILYKKLCFLDE